MDNAYICNFINSRDIRNHLREIDYRFSVPEYAYLIWQSRNHSVEQRHKEWKQLINSTETCMIKTSKWKEDSAKQYFSQEVQLQAARSSPFTGAATAILIILQWNRPSEEAFHSCSQASLIGATT